MKFLTIMLALPLAALGCVDYEPDVGQLLAEPTVDGGQGQGASVGCDNKDTDFGKTVSFVADVRPLMTRSPGGCASCHLGRVTSALDLSSYEAMRRGGLYSGTRIIVDRDPCHSILLQKLSRTPPYGSRMPLNGPPYFSPEELTLVHDWIAEGAANN